MRLQTLKDAKIAVHSYLSSLQDRFKSQTPSIIMANYFSPMLKDSLRDLKNKLHPGDALLVGCHPLLYRRCVRDVGGEAIGLITEDIPLDFHSAHDGFDFSLGGEEDMMERYHNYTKWLKRGQCFTMFQRDNGFLQVGDKVVSIKGNRWNGFNTFSFLEPTFIDGGNFVSDGKDIILTMSSVTEQELMETEFGSRRELLQPIFGSSLCCLPNLASIFGLSHADLFVMWLNEDALGYSVFENVDNKLNKALTTLMESIQKEMYQKFKRQVNIFPIPCFNLRPAKTYDVRGLYAQSIVTDNAIYVPKFSKENDIPTEEMKMNHKIQLCDELAKQSMEEAEKKYGKGRPVIPIDSRTLSMGNRGGLHCLTTQLRGNPALRLIEDLKRKEQKFKKKIVKLILLNITQ